MDGTATRGPTAYESWAQRVVFASRTGAEAVAQEVQRLGAERVLLIAGEPELPVAHALTAGVPVAATFSAVRPHVPPSVVDGVREAVKECAADLLLCVGGGSTTGAAKAGALVTDLPILAVPTTYAGSEATPVWGLTESGRKSTGVDPRVLPAVVVYDATLHLTLPTTLSVTSGLNALAHCVDSLWAPRHNPISSALATEGIRRLADGLRAVVDDGTDLVARESLLYGTYLAGVSFAGAGSGLHHKICHVLGGAYDLEHAALHSVVLPHVVGFNLPSAPGAAARLREAFGADPFPALLDLYRSVDAPRDLGSLGLGPEQVDQATDLVLAQVPDSNPRPISHLQMHDLLTRARDGRDPQLVPIDETERP